MERKYEHCIIVSCSAKAIYEDFGFFFIKKADNMRAEAFVAASSCTADFCGEGFLGDLSSSFVVFFCFGVFGFVASPDDARFLELDLVSLEAVALLLLGIGSGF